MIDPEKTEECTEEVKQCPETNEACTNDKPCCDETATTEAA